MGYVGLGQSGLGWARPGLAQAHPQITLNLNLAPFVFLEALVSLRAGPGPGLGWAGRAGLGQGRPRPGPIPTGPAQAPKPTLKPNLLPTCITRSTCVPKGRPGPRAASWAAWSRDLYLVLYCSYSSYKVINYINSYKCIRNYIGKCITILITSVKPPRFD